MLSIGFNGASGRMGQEIIARILAQRDIYSLNFAKVSIAEVQDLSQLNLGMSYVNQLPENNLPDVVIDFSTPSSTLELINWCLLTKTPLVIGTTGFSEIQKEVIQKAASHIPIVLSPNMSLSVNVLFHLVATAAKSLAKAEVEITESHHRNKKDSPSGTALRLGEAVADARQQDFTQVAKFNRARVENVRKPDEIGFSVIRGGDVVGKHTVSFLCDGEELNLTSEITNRKSFADGSLSAARFIVTQSPSLYDMSDVLGL